MNENVARIPIDLPDGGIEFVDPNEAMDASAAPFDANLAEYLDDDVLQRIGSDLIESIEADEDTREDWQNRIVRGIETLGALDSPMTDGAKAETSNEEGLDMLPEWASRVNHPMITQGVVQFQARAMAENFPAAGPAKCQVPGEAAPEDRERAERVAEFLNYQFTVEMPEAYEEMDKLLFWLPLQGSAFTKIFYDDAKQRPSLRMIMADDMIVPYHAESLADASRATVVLKYPGWRMYQLIDQGYFADVDPVPHTGGADDVGSSTLTDALDQLDGREAAVSEYLEDIYYVYEVHARLSIPGLDGDERDSIFDGTKPYIVHLDKNSHKVLRIKRNWREEDQFHRPVEYFTHFKYMPGAGFYGFGLLHLIGDLQKAATGALRSVLDAAHRNNMPSGFIARDAKMGGENWTPQPGEFLQVEVDAEDLNKGIVPLPFNEPSSALISLMGMLVDTGRDFMSTTEAMTGGDTGNTAVGTMLARIEQGHKVFSQIHQRTHRAVGHQLRILQRLNREFIVDDMGAGYPYNIKGDERRVFAEDFAGAVTIVPVSDPNIFSETQRHARYQATLDLAGQFPDLFDQRYLAEEGLRVIGYENPDEFLSDQDKVPRLDVVSEHDAMMRGLPVMAFIDQGHDDHMAAHEAWFMNLPEQFQSQMEGPYLAHMAEHYSFKARVEISQQLGVPLPPPDMTPSEYQKFNGIDPEMERQISAAVAMLMMQQQQQQIEQQGEQVDPEAEAAMMAQEQAMQQAQADMELKAQQAQASAQIKQGQAEAEIQIKAAQAQADAQRKDTEAQAQIELEAAIAQADQVRKDAESAAKIKREDRAAKQKPKK